jgi:hypothetical protein
MRPASRAISLIGSIRVDTRLRLSGLSDDTPSGACSGAVCFYEVLQLLRLLRDSKIPHSILQASRSHPSFGVSAHDCFSTGCRGVVIVPAQTSPSDLCVPAGTPSLLLLDRDATGRSACIVGNVQ